MHVSVCRIFLIYPIPKQTPDVYATKASKNYVQWRISLVIFEA